MEILCAVELRGNDPGKRIGIVKFYETGYYPSTFDRPEYTQEEVKEEIHYFNQAQGVPDDVAESAEAGSMFGWHVPAAQKAIEFYKAKSLAS